MSNYTERERLERIPLKYELVVYRGREILKRTTATGELTAVLVDAHHLGVALGATKVEYTRLRQVWPVLPLDANEKPKGPKWWLARLGQVIDAGVTYELEIRHEAREPDVALTAEDR